MASRTLRTGIGLRPCPWPEEHIVTQDAGVAALLTATGDQAVVEADMPVTPHGSRGPKSEDRALSTSPARTVNPAT